MNIETVMNKEYPYLEKIHSPDDLKKFSLQELPEVADDIRRKIINVLAKTGGHLSSNLGVIELTLALHYVFDSPHDKFIFDVGHQMYTHKLITGRNNDQFLNIRSDGGLSGFSCPTESEHDLFFSGHAGNALSLALGLAARSESSKDHVIPFIGDASLSCGLSLEALNNISEDTPNLIVILNDNKMSISENVGKIAHVLIKLLNNPTASKLTKKLEKLVKKIPGYGLKLMEYGKQLSTSLKNLFSPAPFFEQFGLSYIGPVDGHDIRKLIPLLQSVKNQPFPIIIHAVTVKGRGVEDAQTNPSLYHGVSPNFDKKSCEYVTPENAAKQTFPKIFGQQIEKLGELYPELHVITPAMSLGSCLEDFKMKYPERFFDVGIAEGHAVTFSAGIAKQKSKKIVCSIYSSFLSRAFDNLFHDVCLQNLPVIFGIDRAGLAYGDGMSHQGIYDIGFLRSMPNMIICQPRNGLLLRELLISSLSWNVPVAIRYPNKETQDPKLTPITREIGKGEILTRGEDLLIIGLGHMADLALTLREIFLSVGILPTVFDPIFVKPLDKNLLSLLLMSHTKVIIIEEHSVKTGLAAEFNEFLVNYHFKADVLNFGVPDIFLSHGKSQTVLKNIGLTAEQIFTKSMTAFGMKQNNRSSGIKL